MEIDQYRIAGRCVGDDGSQGAARFLGRERPFEQTNAGIIGSHYRLQPINPQAALGTNELIVVSRNVDIAPIEVMTGAADMASDAFKVGKLKFLFGVQPRDLLCYRSGVGPQK